MFNIKHPSRDHNKTSNGRCEGYQNIFRLNQLYIIYIKMIWLSHQVFVNGVYLNFI